MKTAWESTLVFISAGTACSQDQDGAVQIGRDDFGPGRSPGNGPVHRLWVGGLSRSAHGFMCHASPRRMNVHWQGNTHNIQNIHCVPLIEAFYQLIWKCFPRGNHQLARHKNSPQTGSPTLNNQPQDVTAPFRRLRGWDGARDKVWWSDRGIK